VTPAPIPDLPPAPQSAVHRRSIIMDSYEVDDEHVTVVGRLTDVQPWGGPGHNMMHAMTLTVTVRLADLVITSAEAGMGTFPHASQHPADYERGREAPAAPLRRHISPNTGYQPQKGVPSR
jgi:hypothetical protein